jgi:hypothetical protein
MNKTQPQQLNIRLIQRWYVDKLDNLAERTGRNRIDVARSLLMAAIETCYPEEGPIITTEDVPKFEDLTDIYNQRSTNS